MRLIFILLIGFSVYGQDNLTLGCFGNTVLRNEVRHIDTLFINDKYFLLQDNSVTYVRHIVGSGILQRADAGGGVWHEKLEIDRRVGDSNPMIILWGCHSKFKKVLMSRNITVIYAGEPCYKN